MTKRILNRFGEYQRWLVMASLYVRYTKKNKNTKNNFGKYIINSVEIKYLMRKMLK